LRMTSGFLTSLKLHFNYIEHYYIDSVNVCIII
jgi:hypothetical protein